MLRFRNVNVYFKPDLPNIWVELKPVNEVDVEEGQFKKVVFFIGDTNELSGEVFVVTKADF